MENKKMKLWKKILLVLLVLFILWLILVARRFIIITKLVNEAQKYNGKTNYIAVVQSLQDGTVNIMKSYRKDGDYLTTIKVYSPSIKEERGLTVYRKENEVIGILQSGEDKVALIDGNILAGDIQVANALSIISNNVQKIQFAITSTITKEKCNGRDCYLIKVDNSRIWVDKESGLVIRNMNGTWITERFYEFDVVKDENIQKPDISDCRIREEN